MKKHQIKYMQKANVYNLNGEVVSQVELDPHMFDVAVQPVLVQQVVVAHQNNQRRPWAHTKDRSEVRGGGKKPWKQKGTGRARHGSSRSPIWVGGGVTFGPRAERNYSTKINKKMKKKALKMVLSDKFKNDKLIFVDSLEVPEAKTKKMAENISKLPIKGKKYLFISQFANKNLVLATRNIATVSVLPENSLNVIDLLKADVVVLPVKVLPIISEIYS